MGQDGVRGKCLEIVVGIAEDGEAVSDIKCRADRRCANRFDHVGDLPASEVTVILDAEDNSLIGCDLSGDAQTRHEPIEVFLARDHAIESTRLDPQSSVGAAKNRLRQYLRPGDTLAELGDRVRRVWAGEIEHTQSERLALDAQ